MAGNRTRSRQGPNGFSGTNRLSASFKTDVPLGGLMKNEVRDIARVAKLPSAQRKDSQGICFLGKINYNDFLRRFLGEKEGAIIEMETGKRIGTHKGYWFHTIGQRKGLGLSGGPWFVIRKDIDENIIYVSRGYDTEKQYGTDFALHDFHFITEDLWEGDSPVDVSFKIRHTDTFMKGTLTRGNGLFQIHSHEPLQGIAPGQFGVLYDKDAEICVEVAKSLYPKCNIPPHPQSPHEVHILSLRTRY